MNGQKKKNIRFIIEYTASFAVLFLLIYLGFILNHRSFVWFYDGNKQHFPALLYLRDYYLKVAGNFFFRVMKNFGSLFRSFYPADV